MNNPAFEAIRPLTAKKSETNLPAVSAAGAIGNKLGATAPPSVKQMKTPQEIEAEKAALEARNVQLATRITELEAKDDAVSKAELRAEKRRSCRRHREQARRDEAGEESGGRGRRLRQRAERRPEKQGRRTAARHALPAHSAADLSATAR